MNRGQCDVVWRFRGNDTVFRVVVNSFVWNRMNSEQAMNKNCNLPSSMTSLKYSFAYQVLDGSN